MQDSRTLMLSFFDLVPAVALSGDDEPNYSVENKVLLEIQMFSVAHWKLNDAVIGEGKQLKARVKFFNPNDTLLVEEHPVAIRTFQKTHKTLTTAIYIARFPFSGFGEYRFNVELEDERGVVISSAPIDTPFEFLSSSAG